MYQAPDRYRRLISARLPGGESAGLAAREADPETSPLRDVQLISRAQLAPFFAAANIVASLIMVANLWGVVSSTWLLPWVGAVAAVNLGAVQLARTQSITCVGRAGHRVPSWLLVGEVAVRAVTFLGVPLYLFPTLDPGTQIIAASVMAGLGVAFVSVHAVRGEVASRRLAAVRLRGIRIQRHFHVIHSEARTLSAGARALVALLSERAAKRGRGA